MNRTAGILLIFVITCALPLVAQPPPADPLQRSLEELRETFRSLEPDFAGVVDDVKQRAAILGDVNAAVAVIESSPPSRKPLEEALRKMVEAEQKASAIRGGGPFHPRQSLAAAVDRLRTELLNPTAYDPARLADDLHHSVVHRAASFYRGAVAEARAVWLQVTALRQGLLRFATALAAEDGRGAPIPEPGTREVPLPTLRFQQGDRSHELARALSGYQSGARELQSRLALHAEISVLIIGAIHDLDTFQNAIGLQKAQERLRDASKRAGERRLQDGELAAALEYGSERLRVALLSPSSADMTGLREDLHHNLVHPAELALMRVSSEARAQSVLLTALERDLSTLSERFQPATSGIDSLVAPTLSTRPRLRPMRQ